MENLNFIPDLILIVWVELFEICSVEVMTSKKQIYGFDPFFNAQANFEYF